MRDRHSPDFSHKFWLVILATLLTVAIATARPATEEQNQKVESVVEKDNVSVFVAFTLLVDCCLLNGTRLTSGFRAANDQLRVIRHYAQIEGIQVPIGMRVDKPETWQPVLAELRKRKYVIADPDKTPHASDDLIVFDLSGANQSAIEAACYKARDKGLVKITRIIREGSRQANDKLEEALQIAREGSGKFSEFQGLATRLDLMIKLNLAKEIFLTRNCQESEKAREAIAQARQLDSSNPIAARLEREIDSWASRCSSSSYFIIALKAD